ncbi:hypothetical protein ABZU76_19465 [Amycolatopsis sp. NPDC005232]|uniref:hypothetical protein n=1 Tax=Amycolatopsis sp. NPDC005232 TaxID=3157027 RepID=UPI0033BD6031
MTGFDHRATTVVVCEYLDDRDGEQVPMVAFHCSRRAVAVAIVGVGVGVGAAVSFRSGRRRAGPGRERRAAATTNNPASTLSGAR